MRCGVASAAQCYGVEAGRNRRNSAHPAKVRILPAVLKRYYCPHELSEMKKILHCFDLKTSVWLKGWKKDRTFLAHYSYEKIEAKGTRRRVGKEILAMKMNYFFAQLSRQEREFLEMVLLEEMDNQRWYSVAFVSVFGEEIFLTLQ